MSAPNPRGIERRLSRETIWLLNRRAIADRWDTTPVAVENWPSYERDVELKWMEIEAEAERRRPKRKR